MSAIKKPRIFVRLASCLVGCLAPFAILAPITVLDHELVNGRINFMIPVWLIMAMFPFALLLFGFVRGGQIGRFALIGLFAMLGGHALQILWIKIRSGHESVVSVVGFLLVLAGIATLTAGAARWLAESVTESSTAGR